MLFGTELYKCEFAGLLMHAEHLEAVHGVGSHTISVPRVKRADVFDKVRNIAALHIENIKNSNSRDFRF